MQQDLAVCKNSAARTKCLKCRGNNERVKVAYTVFLKFIDKIHAHSTVTKTSNTDEHTVSMQFLLDGLY